MLIERIEKLERRLAELESKLPGATASSEEASSNEARKETPLAATYQAEDSSRAEIPRREAEESKATTSNQASGEDRAGTDFLRETTINLMIDTYYGYNFNRPAGRVNLLRAYDLLSNSFTLNQAALIIERATDVEKGRRFGARLDLQFGQATETVQGNAVNELRPQAYRHLWQAYGTYVAPVGRGLTMDFGKFASSLGYETNYAKDNYNYSRSYFFNFLPYYHLGLRAKLPINDKLTAMYHVVNGAQQSEDFNGFKSQHVALALTPSSKFTAQVNYYSGQEQRDVAANYNPALPSQPTQPGLPTEIIRPVPKGRLHILDAYASWAATDRLALAVEADYVVNRVEENSAPARVAGGALYAHYQFTPRLALNGRFEYLSDRGGLFSGATQALKETTATADYKIGEGFLLRGEWRRDFSNQAFFLTEEPGRLKSEQNTATIGVIWWFGRKEGAW